MTSGGLFLTLLTTLFIGLKLGGVITWSWWLVLLPLYGPTVIVFILVLVAALLTKLSNKPW